MDLDCQRIVDNAAYWNAAGSATWIALACTDFFVSFFLAVRAWQERSRRRVSSGFSHIRYLGLLCAAMFFISVSSFALGIGTFLSDDVILSFFGSRYFAAWQFMYSFGQVFLLASKVLVFIRLLHFCAKSSKGLSAQRIKVVRVLIWSIVGAYAVVSIISAAILFFDSFAPQPSRRLFEVLSTAIVLARCVAFTSLAIVFAYGGYAR
jgi:hypothetical protein